MTRFACGGLALLVLSTAPVAAADLYRNPPPSPVYSTAPTAAYSWLGPYVGLNAGYGWGEIGPNSTLEPSGFIGGATIGANWQWGSLVFGPEADIMFSGLDDGSASASKWELDWLGTVRGRVGAAWDRFLPYVTGGLAYGKGVLTTPAFKDDVTHIGWTVGAGVEAAVTQTISAKIEYLYVDLGEKTYGPPGTRAGFDGNLLRAGVNYRF